MQKLFWILKSYTIETRMKYKNVHLYGWVQRERKLFEIIFGKILSSWDLTWEIIWWIKVSQIL